MKIIILVGSKRRMAILQHWQIHLQMVQEKTMM